MYLYDPHNLLNYWLRGQMTNDMAIGQALQHIAKLYQYQVQASKCHPPPNYPICSRCLAGQLLQAQTERVQQLVDSLDALNQTVMQLNNEVNSLKVSLAKDNG
ncbi:hypothetical protein QUF58_10165 [Anaerolineales bacterium HSG24]|nr:hypothetical protein [Anaerolineales bacterium HSG24]